MAGLGVHMPMVALSFRLVILRMAILELNHQIESTKSCLLSLVRPATNMSRDLHHLILSQSPFFSFCSPSLSR